MRVRNLKTGKTIDKTFKSGETVEAADVVETDMQYLYTDGEFWHFMVADTFEQYAADVKAVGDVKDWITDGDVCGITLWNDVPLIVNAPNFVELEITQDRSWSQGRYREWRRQTCDLIDGRCCSGASVRGSGRGNQSRYALARIRFARQIEGVRRSCLPMQVRPGSSSSNARNCESSSL